MYFSHETADPFSAKKYAKYSTISFSPLMGTSARNACFVSGVGDLIRAQNADFILSRTSLGSLVNCGLHSVKSRFSSSQRAATHTQLLILFAFFTHASLFPHTDRSPT